MIITYRVSGILRFAALRRISTGYRMISVRDTIHSSSPSTYPFHFAQSSRTTDAAAVMHVAAIAPLLILPSSAARKNSMFSRTNRITIQ